jgi:two-component system, NarL family, sensor kinase
MYFASLIHGPMVVKLLRLPLLSVVFLWSMATAQAQDAALDSMLQHYRSGKHSPKLLNDLCWSYVFNDPDSAIFFGKKALALSRRLKNVGNEATAFNRMGVAFDVKHMPDSALLYYHQAVALSKGTGGERATLASALNNIGLIHWNLGELERAVEFYVRSAELFEELDNAKGLANTYNNIGLVLWQDGNLKEALAYTLKALRLRETLNDRYGMAASYTNLGAIHLELPTLDSALYWLKLSVPIKEEIKDGHGLAKSLHNIGYAYQELGRYEDAEKYLRQSLEVSLRLGNSHYAASTLLHLSKGLRHAGNPKGSLEHIARAEALIDSVTDVSLVWKLYEEKARVHAKLGNYEEALRMLFLRNGVKDSLLTAEKSEAMAELETRYRTAVKDRKIEEQERQVAEASLLAQRRNTYIALLVLLLIILLLFGFSYIQFTRRKADRERDAVIIAEREMGLRAVITATEEERKRIAKDLHDGVVQGLTGLKLRLQNQLRTANMDEAEKETFTQTSSLLDESINELRSISHQMMPRALAELGLLPALDDLLEKAFGHSDIRFSFEHHRVDGQRFDERLEISLYRITQELINNIIRHSGAKAVSVQLLRTATHLVLVVEDDGKGFRYEDAANRNGIGLMNISSRAKALNGEVNYTPSPQQGTVATIRIPIA